jgi:saccharopine dehydrogenase (NAD+, L-lysine-forming)
LLEEDYQPELFVAGQWRRVGWRNMRRFDFGPDFGRRICVPFEFPEMHDLPQQLGLREAGCYVAGFNWFVDNLVFPTAMLLNRVKRGLGMQSLSRCLVWGLDTFSRPPFGVVMRLEAEGEKDGKPQAVSVVLRHADPYEFSAIPVVACMRQYLDGTIARPGVGLMGEVVEPTRLFADLQRMGICIEITGEAAPAAPGDGPRVTPSTAAGTDHRSAC